MDQFQRVALNDNVEILMHKNGNYAMVAWPWFAEDSHVESATWHAQTMGFQDVIEMGNMQGYRIPEVECDDWDYVLMVAT